jgi:hypothetical protein
MVGIVVAFGRVGGRLVVVGWMRSGCGLAEIIRIITQIFILGGGLKLGGFNVVGQCG